MRYQVVFAVILVFVALALSSPAIFAQAAPAAAPAVKTDSAAQPAVPAAPVKAPAKPKMPPVTRAFETQISGFASDYADQLFGRLSFQEKKGGKDWFIRGSLSRTATESGSSKTHVTTTRLDFRDEQARRAGRYDVFAGVMSERERDLSSTRSERSGYHSLSYGIGKKFDARNRGDIGIGVLNIYDEDDGTKPALSCSIIGRRPLNSKLSVDAHILAFQPLDKLSDTKVDSEVGLSYDVSPEISLRFGWSANNLVRPIRGAKEWDSVLRFTISFRRTTTH